MSAAATDTAAELPIDFTTSELLTFAVARGALASLCEHSLESRFGSDDSAVLTFKATVALLGELINQNTTPEERSFIAGEIEDAMARIGTP